ncbi:MAG: hypothetical protein H7Y60_00315 [Rhodospirillaceae bacterium]|nr:hypothetical protein [Rhodospirillales bacterium]
MKRIIRERIFIGCEGLGERALVMALHRFIESWQRQNGLSSTATVEPYIARGGSPHLVVVKSIKERDRLARQGRFASAFALVDNDRLREDGQEASTRASAQRKELILVVQDTNLECLLGRLLALDFALGPQRAGQELVKLWPNYCKSFDAPTLQAKLTHPMVCVLAQSDDS